ncbi:MAG: hypothetical protein CMH27_04755 [Micavibrio sp.]|nr:hypothetical protein [Micavibrio sp.]
MNNDIIQGKWKQLTGEVQKHWGKLTDDQLAEIDGDREKLIGQIQENYGVVRDEAEEQVKQFEDKMAA